MAEKLSGNKDLIQNIRRLLGIFWVQPDAGMVNTVLVANDYNFNPINIIRTVVAAGATYTTLAETSKRFYLTAIMMTSQGTGVGATGSTLTGVIDGVSTTIGRMTQNGSAGSSTVFCGFPKPIVIDSGTQISIATTSTGAECVLYGYYGAV